MIRRVRERVVANLVNPKVHFALVLYKYLNLIISFHISDVCISLLY